MDIFYMDYFDSFQLSPGKCGQLMDFKRLFKGRQHSLFDQGEQLDCTDFSGIKKRGRSPASLSLTSIVHEMCEYPFNRWNKQGAKRLIFVNYFSLTEVL